MIDVLLFLLAFGYTTVGGTLATARHLEEIPDTGNVVRDFAGYLWMCLPLLLGWPLVLLHEWLGRRAAA